MKYILILMLLPTSAFASGDRTTTTNVYNNTTIEDSRGVATAIASAQHHFEYDTYSWQGSVGVGSYKGEEALSFGVGKRVGGILLNGSITSESIGVGINWRF